MRHHDERGSVTVWGVLIALVITMVIGITVDLTGQVNAQQRAHDLAQQAGRTAANQVQAGQIMRGQSPQIDTARRPDGRGGLPACRRRRGQREHHRTDHPVGARHHRLPAEVPRDRRHRAQDGQRRRHHPAVACRERSSPMNPPPRHPRLVGFAASVALLALLVGLPTVLLALGWGPTPSGLDGWWAALTSPDDGHLTVLVLKVAAWIVWGLLAITILTGGSRGPPRPGGTQAARAPVVPGAGPPARDRSAAAVHRGARGGDRDCIRSPGQPEPGGLADGNGRTRSRPTSVGPTPSAVALSARRHPRPSLTRSSEVRPCGRSPSTTWGPGAATPRSSSSTTISCGARRSSSGRAGC